MPKRKKSAIWKAAQSGAAESLKKLLDAGEDANAADNMGETPLHVAALYSNIEAAKLLIERGADVNALSENNDTPLSCALRVCSEPWDTPRDLAQRVRDGRIVARMLLEHGADPNAERGLGYDTLLCEAVRARDVEDVRLLLEFGADCAPGGGLRNHGGTLLHAALPLGYIADRANTDPRVDTFPEEEALCEILLQHGADPNCLDSEGNTPLRECIALNLYQMAAFLLKHGATPNAADANGSFPLHKAAALCRAETTALLLDYGADMNAGDYTGGTPLHAAVAACRTAPAALLLERGANVDAADHHGRTPLHLSVFRCTWPLTKLLLHHGANPYAKDEHGQTPLDWEKDEDLRALMLKHASHCTK